MFLFRYDHPSEERTNEKIIFLTLVIEWFQFLALGIRLMKTKNNNT